MFCQNFWKKIQIINIKNEGGNITIDSKDIKRIITEYTLHRSLPCCAKGACIIWWKLWAVPCRATQDRWATVESSDKTLEEGTANHSSISAVRTAWIYKRTRHDTERWVPETWRCPICYLGRAEENSDQPQKERSSWAKAEMMLSCERIWWWK